MILEKVLDQIEVVLGRHVQLLVHLPDAHETVLVTNGNTTTIKGPLEAAERARIIEVTVAGGRTVVARVLRAVDLLARDRRLHILVDVPQVNIAVTVDGGEDGRVHRRPLDVVDVFLAGLERVDGRVLELVLRVPQLHGPVHTGTEHELAHVGEDAGIGLGVTHGPARMHSDGRDGCLMTLERTPLDLLAFARSCRVHGALINIVIFGANKELVSLVLRELERVNANIELLVLTRRLVSLLIVVEHVEVDLRVVELATVPLAHLAVIRDTDDVVRVLCSDHAQRIDRVLVTLTRENTVLDRRGLRANIPLYDVTGLRATNDDIRLERVKQSLGDLILARQRDLGTRLQVERENVDEAIRLIVAILTAFAITAQEQLVML